MLKLAKAKAERTSALDFFGSKTKFSFICNRAMDGKPFTPRRLRRKLPIVRNFRNLKSVVAYATTSNLDSLMEIVEEWTDLKIPVFIAFPTLCVIPTSDEKYALGIPVNECYEPKDGGHTLTSEFRRLVADMFKQDRIVFVEV